jgi:ribonuclease PH
LEDLPLPRSYSRRANQLRPVAIRRNFVRTADGSCLIELGETRVICTASLSPGVPAWMKDSGRGWLTAEYAMLPASTGKRKERRADGRAVEIQRLIGRALRAVARLERLDGLTLTIDCDVLQADGGTRTASITGAWVAAVEALWRRRKLLPSGRLCPFVAAVVATSAGLVGGRAMLDLDYREDSAADVDVNLVLTDAGRLIEVQAAGEESTFTERDLARLVALGRQGCRQLAVVQRRALSPGALNLFLRGQSVD